VELELREKALQGRHRDEWLSPIRPWLHPAFDPDRDPKELDVFRGGFVETAFVDAERFLADPDGLFAAAPVTGLVFWVGSAMLPRLLACPALRRVRRLRLMSWRSRVHGRRQTELELGPHDFTRLAVCPHLEQVQELDLTSQVVPTAEVAALITSRHLANLQTLKLAHSCVNSGGFAEIGRRMALPALRRLELNNNYESGRFQTWRGGWYQSLQTLDLSQCGLTVEEVVSFLGGSAWPELENLSLGRLEGQAATGALGRPLSGMPRLTSLDLSYRRFGEASRALIGGGQLDALESLDLGSAFSPLDVSALFSRVRFPRLHALDLCNNRLKGGLAAVRDAPVAATLRRLDVQHCGASLDDTITFARTARMPALEALAIGVTQAYTPRVLAALGAAEGFPRLRSLSLRVPGRVKLYEALAATSLLAQVSHLKIHGGTVGTNCIAALTDLPGFQHLSYLEFYGSSVNPTNRRRLRDHFGERFLG
jgi:hypothetical protein